MKLTPTDMEFVKVGPMRSLSAREINGFIDLTDIMMRRIMSFYFGPEEEVSYKIVREEEGDEH